MPPSASTRSQGPIPSLGPFAGGRDGAFFKITAPHIDVSKAPGVSPLPPPTAADWLWDAVRRREAEAAASCGDAACGEPPACLRLPLCARAFCRARPRSRPSLLSPPRRARR